MYICNECGASFSEPAEIVETHGFSYGPYERFPVCPVCRSTDFEPMYRCEKCGAAIPESQNAYHMCAACERSALERFKNLLIEQFDADELRFLSECVEYTSMADPEKIPYVGRVPF